MAKQKWIANGKVSPTEDISAKLYVVRINMFKCGNAELVGGGRRKSDTY